MLFTNRHGMYNSCNIITGNDNQELNKDVKQATIIRSLIITCNTRKHYFTINHPRQFFKKTKIAAIIYSSTTRENLQTLSTHSPDTWQSTRIIKKSKIKTKKKSPVRGAERELFVWCFAAPALSQSRSLDRISSGLVARWRILYYKIIAMMLSTTHFTINN